MKKSGLIIALVVVIVLVGGAFALIRGDDDNKPANTNTVTPPPAATTAEPPAPAAPSPTADEDTSSAATIILYSDNGFSPASSTVKAGSNVTVKNSSSRTLEFASDPHPAHTENRELNIGSIRAGESKTFTVANTGSWGFHNHQNPGDTGTLTVE